MNLDMNMNMNTQTSDIAGSQGNPNQVQVVQVSQPVMMTPEMLASLVQNVVLSMDGLNAGKKVHLSEASGYRLFSGGQKETMDWLDQLENRFVADMGRLPLKEDIAKVAGLFRGAAWSWYRSLMKEGDICMNSWESFKMAFLREFKPLDSDLILRRRLRELKQAGSLEKYNAEFRNIAVGIADMSESEKLFNYLEGLKRVTAGEVRARMPKTVQEAMHVAIAYDQARFS